MKHAAQDVWGISKVCGPQSHRCSTRYKHLGHFSGQPTIDENDREDAALHSSADAPA